MNWGGEDDNALERMGIGRVWVIAEAGDKKLLTAKDAKNGREGRGEKRGTIGTCINPKNSEE